MCTNVTSARRHNCNQMMFLTTKSAARILKTCFAAHASSCSSQGGYTRHERAAEIEPIQIPTMNVISAIWSD